MSTTTGTVPDLPVQAPDDLIVGTHKLLRGHSARYYFRDRALILPAGLTEQEQRAEVTGLFGEATEEIMTKVRTGIADEAAKQGMADHVAVAEAQQ